MSRPIVVPLDGTPRAEHALVPVVPLARAAGCDVHLLHVRAERNDDIAGVVDAYLQALADHIADDTGAARIVTEQRSGPVGREIVRYAKKVDAALIVMGTRHQDGLHPSVVASVAESVARRAGMPVMLTGPETTPVQRGAERKCRRILVPLDGSPRGQQIVAGVAALAAAYNARVTLLRVLPVTPLDVGYPSVPLGAPLEVLELQRDAMAELENVAQVLRAQGMSADTRVVQTVGPVVATILNEAADTHADMIALATRGHGRARRFAFGSVAHELVKSGELPLLIISPQEAADESRHRDRSHVVEVPNATA